MLLLLLQHLLIQIKEIQYSIPRIFNKIKLAAHSKIATLSNQLVFNQNFINKN